jgi:hypothetical protein
MKLPKQISEKSKTQKVIDLHVEIGYAADIDPEAINRFIYRTFGEETVDHKDALQVASLLTALMEGTRAGDDMSVELQRILDIKKNRKRKFDPKTAKPATLEWHVVVQYRLGLKRRVDAIEEFMDEFGYKDRTAQRYVDELTPRVDEAIKANPDYYEKYRQNLK